MFRRWWADTFWQQPAGTGMFFCMCWRRCIFVAWRFGRLSIRRRRLNKTVLPLFGSSVLRFAKWGLSDVVNFTVSYLFDCPQQFLQKRLVVRDLVLRYVNHHNSD